MNVLPEKMLISEQVTQALTEDLGRDDLTAGLLDEHAIAQAKIICREEAVLCGVAWANEVFHQLDQTVDIDWHAEDGDSISPGEILCLLGGNNRSLLSGERTALNYLQTLSATATVAHQYTEAVSGTGVKILDTRKTIPGLRLQQKYAVTCGGGHNHRVGLYDAILIKENHVRIAGSIAAALQKTKRTAPTGVSIEIEVESLHELQEALKANAERILLDNFDLKMLIEAVKLNAGQARLEASGGVNLGSVRAIAETGVDDISVGALTKDIQAVDLSMLFIG
ncbi:MAG: carboxylating nicotinate-nucleotide diphosphorylase [Candidatus Thiodiazotropha sp. (ex Lucinoma aequizonata)]|nr:carboxylating nicotinate-nucleotide diphosphorylase [Candidatus Thiodiazotropha sp. (ex Lucinoma aequizonata)]MCU7889753.1 carboxylating nicotinate-nucleotide diphosphorylase [Candidatus Thiodiazotropha sp. (ex Lucinoma aequizonata)]MCU7893636.1 carboxylating nicotinate-nucleotide diphosphorylase [Candidatus Thiodiazotropha sp. (ex Lucinoma aequizonata)]MCU7898968.1 carboxylating nicotinate-nucleotide diphosphorylase [Candidatus Thiodiazotropha sp. (ex Lucinoma aequizonata)]MCU7902650.1 carb